MSWLGRVFRRDKLDRELDKELRFHVETREAELRSSGASPEEARRRALAEFGGVEPIKEQARDARGTRWISDIGQDVRYALRMLRANKGFTAAAVLSLAVGLGANAAVFRVIDGLLLRRLDVKNPQELFLVETTDAGTSRFSHPAYLALAEAAPAAKFAVYTAPTSGQLLIDGSAELHNFQLVSGNWFSLLGVPAAAGRLFDSNDDNAASPQPVAVISDAFWLSNFGRARSAIGSTLTLNNTKVTIIGVAAEGFNGISVGQRVDVWAPVTMQPGLNYRSNASTDNADQSKPWVSQSGIAWLAVIGRAPEPRGALLAVLEGKYHQQVEARIADIHDASRRARFLRDRILLTDASRGVSNLRDTLAPALTVLMGMVALVLLVACANLANLLLARGSARSREFALRLSIGARRGRLIRQLLTESVTLALIGGAAGLLLSIWGAPALLRLVSTTSTAAPLVMPMDWRILSFGFGVTVLTGLLFGLIPALRLSRPEMQDALKAGARVVNAGSRRGRPQVAKVLVATQVAVSMLLVVGASLFVQTFRNLMHIDIGVDRTAVLDARFDTRLAGFDESRLPVLYARLIQAAEQLPGVKSATIGLVGPVTGSARTSGIVAERYQPPPDEDPIVQEEYVGPRYFTTLGMRIVAGRDFDERDNARGRKVAVINEAMAKKFFPGLDPVGRGFGYDDVKEIEVVGVVADVRFNGLKGKVPRLAYYPIAQHGDEFAKNLYVRAAGATSTLPSAIKDAIRRVEPGLAVREVVTIDELAERTVSAERLVSRLTAAFGFLGVFVACFGLYGTIAYSVARRRNEIGVRLALGASPSSVRWMVIRETLLLAVVGAVFGAVLALPLGRYLSTLLYGLSPRDPLTLAASAALVVIVGALAGAVPAWRASRVNPTSALRAD